MNWLGWVIVAICGFNVALVGAMTIANQVTRRPGRCWR